MKVLSRKRRGASQSSSSYTVSQAATPASFVASREAGIANAADGCRDNMQAGSGRDSGVDPVLESRRVTQRASILAPSLTALMAAISFFVLASVLQYGFSASGELPIPGFLTWLPILLYSGLGFTATVFLSVLVTLWSGAAFLSGKLATPMRRLAASVIFALCLSMLTASLGHEGGSFGNEIAHRLLSVMGQWLSVLVLGTMSLIAVLIATDWFFFQTFREMATSSVPIAEDPGLLPGEQEHWDENKDEWIAAARADGVDAEIE